MITRLVGAAVRATLMALLIVMPALMLPGVESDVAQVMALMALAAAAFVFIEYVSDYPSLIEFRSAPPFNRLRFLALFMAMILLTLISRGDTSPSALTEWLSALGGGIGTAMDFPFSPVRLMVLAAPETLTEAQLALVRSHAGLAYLISLVTLILFVAFMRLMDWPVRYGAFNFWVNLPLFDPTTGGDVLRRLKRDSHVNVAFGFLLPFLIPAVLKAAMTAGMPVNMADAQTLIWTMIAWSFLPASMILRGAALMRIADLIEEKRRRAYAQANLQPV